ncbi:mucin-2-like isoform X2 [Eriocheir sinensis]|uniref:mucin-2-like isoform X2 n=1 Tax=Eriocheir sinensis TaxID=95602 RepID=UPI0021CA3159|nr:mucin-2-like isoform X2 [Eriocheir sinensis]XP_050716610.1 mucin-2-like isoform X2 [Eriocheir sinensis]
MDDDGQKQRLLDVIGDPHALETFLETLPSSGLDSPRFDNVTSSTDSGLVSSCLDSLVFDGQFLGQVRGGSHPLNHSQVPPHVLQQVLPSPTLSVGPPGTPHAPQQLQHHLPQQQAEQQEQQQQPPPPPPPPPQQQPQQPQQQQQEQPPPQPQHDSPEQQHTLQQQQNVALQAGGAPIVPGAPSTDGEGTRENDHPTLQQLLASSATFPPQQQQQQQTPQPSNQPQHIQHPQNAASGHSLPPTIHTAGASRQPSMQQPPTAQQQISVQPAPRPVSVKSQGSPATKGGQNVLLNTSQPVPQVISQAATQPPQQIMSNGVQLVGGPSQVITSGGQIITSASTQLLQGTQLLQAPGSTQVLPSQILPGGQVLHNGQVIQGGQVLPGPHLLPSGQILQSGQVIQGGQVLQGGQIIQGNQVINNSQLIATTAQMASSGVSGLGAPSAPIQVAPSAQAIPQQTHTVTLHQSVQPPTPASPFSVLSKSPGTVLPRTSPSPSPYHPTTPSPHPGVQSPAPYTTRSPAPSPHSNVSAMRSPAPPTPSPAATPTPQTHTSIATIPQQQPTGMVQSVMGNVGMMQSLMPQLPLSQVMGSNGMVLPQSGVQQTASGVKQVVSGGQLIQIVSSPQPTQPRQPLTTSAHKPIQPKQPQLLPKPPQAAVVGQPAPPPPGKTLIGTRPVTPGGQQPIVIGTTGQQPTMVTGQQGLGGFVINPSMLQSGLQQPFLIQQPNGVLLVRPSGPSGAGGAPGQTLLVPVPSQPQMLSAAGTKAGQHQTVVFPSNGQGGPAYVIPQHGSSGLGAPGVMGAQGSRGPQPIIRLVAPQAPLQLQPIQTPSGPALVAVQTGQAVNLQGLLTPGGTTMRTLTPGVASGPLQLAPTSVAPPSMAPVVSMGHIQLPGGGQPLHVSVPGAPLHLATSLPSSLPSVITTTKQTVIDETVAPASIVTAAEVGTQHQTVTDSSKNTKKKSKKKKREKDTKDEKLRGKGTSINLNDILRETGIDGDLMLFDEADLGLGGEGMEGVQVTPSTAAAQVTAVPTVVTPATMATQAHVVNPVQAMPTAESNVTFTTPSENGGHIVVGSSNPHSLLGMGNTLVTGTVVTNSSQSGLITTSSMPSGMSITLDPSGKFIFGSDPTKAHFGPPIPTATQVGGLVLPTCQSQVQVIGGANVSLSSSLSSVSSGGVANGVGSSMPTIMTGSANAGIGQSALPVGSMPSFTQLLTPPTQAASNVVVHGHGITAKSKPLQFQQTASKLTQVTSSKSQTGADISRVAQNTHLLQTLHLPASEKPLATNGQPFLTSLISGPQTIPSHSGEQLGVPVQVSVSDGGPMLTVVSVGGVMSLPEGIVSTGTTLSSPAPLSILVPSQASQVPQSSAVIVSSSATNSVVSGAILSSKHYVSNSALIPQTSVSFPNTENVPISRAHSQILNPLQDNVPSQASNPCTLLTKSNENHTKAPSFQNEYVATLQRGQTIIDSSKNKTKSYKKKKKDKETEIISPTNASTMIVKHSLQERLKSGTCTSTSGTIQQQLPLAPIPNGLSGPAIKTVSHNIGTSTTSTSLPLTIEAGGQCDTTSIAGSNTSSAPPVTITTSGIVTVTATSQASSTATTATITSATTSTGVMVSVPKQQFRHVRHLILSPQNQEALKKVHAQIQVLQNKKSDQDSACLQQLYAEYRKIMATGKPVTVSTTQQPQIPPTPSQPTPVRYSHPVGHKVITLTQFKQQIKHLPQDQQRQIIDHSKQVLQRCKDPGNNTSFSVTSAPTLHTSPHLSPSTQGTGGSNGSTKITVAHGPSMPTIATSVSSPIVPTTSTTVSSSTTTSSNLSYTKITPPHCSPVSTTAAVSHLSSLGPSPKSLVQSGMVLPPQFSPHPVSASGMEEHSPSQPKTPTATAYSITKEQLFEHQLKTDQNGALNPDYRTPFKNKIDACKRLIRYHVFNECVSTQRELTETSNQFELQAESLLKKFNNMKYKYQSLLVKDSLRRHPSSETVMLYRLFLQEDKTNFEKEKSDIQSGKTIDMASTSIIPTSSESLHTDGLYPWELEWESQKLYRYEPNQKVLKREETDDDEEEEEELCIDNLNDTIKTEVIGKSETEETEDVMVEEEDQKEDKEKELSVVDNDDDDNEEEEDEKPEESKTSISRSESMAFMTEKDLNEFDDSQEGETCLHIHTGDEEEKEDEETTKKEKEEEEEEEEEEKEKQHRQVSHLVKKFNCNSVTYGSDGYSVEAAQHSSSPVTKLSCNNLSDSDSLDEKNGEADKDSEQEEEELVICDGEGASSSLNNSPVSSEVPTLASPSRVSLLNCGENVLSKFSEHLCDNLRLTSNAAKPLNLTGPDPPGNNMCKPAHSPPAKALSDKLDKEKRRERVEKEKKKSDRTKVKERGKDREKEDRPPKKLRIKFKTEERALVPPLRIRTEERGLKLTLKKQEGSGAYYSVGEERKREYRVEPNEDGEEEEEELGGIVRPFEDEEGQEDSEGHGGSSLKEVKVVLQDVLKDKRFKKQVEEKSSKKRRKEKCEEKNDRNETLYSPNSHWINYSQQLHPSEGDKKNLQTTNQDSRTWNCNAGEWRKSGGEGASNVDHSSDHKAREYSSHLYSYSEHFGHEYAGRHNHSQPYGHSGSQQRNTHSYY